MHRKVVIAGCGFVGEAAAGFFMRSGWRVLGLTVSEVSADALRARGLESAACDISQPLVIPAGWESPDVLIHAASSGRGGADAYRAVYRDGMQNLLAAFAPGRAIFAGSTSVYAQTDGSIVTEDSPAEPDRETGRILLEAERVALDFGGFVARFSGLYGPGRSVLLRKFLSGDAVLEDGGSRWINQIHRDDAARALVALATTSAAGGIFNVCDDTPATQREVYGWIAGFFNRPLPPEGPADFSRKRGWTSKRVDNGRLRRLGWAPEFPSYAEALPLLVAQQDSTQAL